MDVRQGSTAGWKGPTAESISPERIAGASMNGSLVEDRMGRSIAGAESGETASRKGFSTGLLLDLAIPDHRLGIPDFSEHGTAYILEPTTENDHESCIVPPLFALPRPRTPPMPDWPPAAGLWGSKPQAAGISSPPDSPSSSISFTLHHNAVPSFPVKKSVSLSQIKSNATSASIEIEPPPGSAPALSAAPASAPPPPPAITPDLYDEIEADPKNPALVRFDPRSGAILAATPAMLVAHITSPVSLDYELLSDFFLAFRGFMSRSELLDHLAARMEWAVTSSKDSGRVVRVRTFVAIRHWILNFFRCDFYPDRELRQRFCSLVNGLAGRLSKGEGGSGNLNILGELKKCWRKTCALYWPEQSNGSPEADIEPGGEPATSDASIPPPITGGGGDFRRPSTPFRLATGSRNDAASRARIPVSPLSEASVYVLSSSVPFLRHVRPSSSRIPGSCNQRVSNLSDAVRADSSTTDPAEDDPLGALDAVCFRGGLVRGLLLQPSPIMPRPASSGTQSQCRNQSPSRDQKPTAKRMVGDARRMLGSRHGRPVSPKDQSATLSADAQRYAQRLTTRPDTPGKRPRTPPRADVLGAYVVHLYRNAFHEMDLPSPTDRRQRGQRKEEDIEPPQRLNSHVTTGSRSILIMDDTGNVPKPVRSSSVDRARSGSSRDVPAVRKRASSCQPSSDMAHPKAPEPMNSFNHWAHTSKPELRSSFKAEVVKLAQLPEGKKTEGVEDALLRLEGRPCNGSVLSAQDSARPFTPAIRSISRQVSSNPKSSFLLNENESLSDLSPPQVVNPKLSQTFFDDSVEDEATPKASPHPRTPESIASRREKGTLQARMVRHRPFILNFDAEVLADQLAIIEKDALDEIDWKELIECRWRPTALPIHNWVEFLKRGDCSGVDLVVSRFNLVVKWVTSECILTENLEERASTITHFIRIASACWTRRNYASTYQLTLGLLSSELSHLEKTWSLVPAAEKSTLAKLETLCLPQRNFKNLRAEMESSGREGGCIPFLGLYTHDLTFNAQQPIRVGDDGCLVNFGRQHRAASIVKSMLNLIEASSRYAHFELQPEALSRCLWIATLEGKELRRRGDGLC
ncbi:ras GEF [Piedraia hortae CBS 480.64]|uniref:Ras GEF n=1 Tax=Piedraia hortae CBS 480.64 TaxID=1314780 RepID=A0A6A7BWF3_9PEZI|nr:ras GEF [Piedraia hortae CBS 480.64]